MLSSCRISGKVMDSVGFGFGIRHIPKAKYPVVSSALKLSATSISGPPSLHAPRPTQQLLLNGMAAVAKVV